MAVTEATALDLKPSRKTGLCLLALDGGGIRGLSALVILKHIMEAIDRENPPMPCDYFDMIGGTSTGGLIAIMLGRLRMSVDDCISTYQDMMEDVFGISPRRTMLHKRLRLPPSLSELTKLQGRFDHVRLEEAVQRVLRERGLSPDEPLSEAGGTKTFVCATNLLDPKTVVLSNYKRSIGCEPDWRDRVRIWEAARATSAAVSFFEPITIQGQKFVDGGLTENNPIMTMWKEADSVFRDGFNWRLENNVKCFLSVGAGGAPPIQPSFPDQMNIRSTLWALSTNNNRTVAQFQKQYAHLGDGKWFFRFETHKGLEDIGLETRSRASQVHASTIAYMNTSASQQLIQDCVRALASRKPGYQRISMVDRTRASKKSLRSIDAEAGTTSTERLCKTTHNTALSVEGADAASSGSGSESTEDYQYGVQPRRFKATDITFAVRILLSVYLAFVQRPLHSESGREQHPGGKSEPRKQGPQSVAIETPKNAGKRKRQRNADDNDENEDHDQTPTSAEAARTLDDREQIFACFFYKFDSEKYNSCVHLELKDINRIKQHLRLCHARPVHCDRCYLVFEGKRDDAEKRRLEHIKKTPVCDSQPQPEFDGLSEDTLKSLSKRVPKDNTKEQNWYILFRKLFPDADLPQSPYLDLGPIVPFGQAISKIEEFHAAEGTRILDEIIKQHMELRQDRALAADFARTVTNEFMRRILRSLRSQHRGRSLPVDTLGQNARREQSTDDAQVEPSLEHGSVDDNVNAAEGTSVDETLRLEPWASLAQTWGVLQTNENGEPYVMTDAELEQCLREYGETLS